MPRFTNPFKDKKQVEKEKAHRLDVAKNEISNAVGSLIATANHSDDHSKTLSSMVKDIKFMTSSYSSPQQNAKNAMPGMMLVDEICKYSKTLDPRDKKNPENNKKLMKTDLEDNMSKKYTKSLIGGTSKQTFNALRRLEHLNIVYNYSDRTPEDKKNFICDSLEVAGNYAMECPKERNFFGDVKCHLKRMNNKYVNVKSNDFSNSALLFDTLEDTQENNPTLQNTAREFVIQ